MMTDDLSIRPARPEDADRAAVLLYSAYTHRQVSYSLHEDGENRFLERLEHFFREADNRFSYQFMQVAEQQAHQHGYAKIALNVARENEQALSLYRRLQYVVTGETVLYLQHHVRLVKRLDNG